MGLSFSMIKTIVSDGGRSAYKPDEKLDCVVRALAVALREHFTYGQVHDILAWHGRKPRHKTHDTLNALAIFGITLQESGSTLNQFASVSKEGRTALSETVSKLAEAEQHFRKI